MRILFVAPQPFYEDRGTPIVIYETLLAFTRLGFKVDVATYPLGSNVILPGINIIRTTNPFRYQNVRVGFSLQKVVLDICLSATVLKLLIRNKYDCIHGVEEGAAIAVLCKRLFGVPVLYDMHSSLPEQLRRVSWFKAGPGFWLSNLTERWLVKKADCIIASQGLLPHIRSLDAEKAVFEWFLVGSASRPKKEEMAKSLGVDGHPTVVYTGTFAPYQDLDVLLEAAAMVRTELPDIIFLLIGAIESELIHYLQMVKKLGLENNVKLHLKCPRHEIPDFLALADVLVLARTSGDNVPLKIYDYLTSGKPIVATNISAHTVILNEAIAILAEPNAVALSRAIIHALRSPDYANKIARAAMNNIQTKQVKPLHEIIAEAYQIVDAVAPK
ncbi:glycosyltransferase family 4 protein [Thermodesulfobacteriota bacterium]